jgi:hypothetical protein
MRNSLKKALTMLAPILIGSTLPIGTPSAMAGADETATNVTPMSCSTWSPANDSKTATHFLDSGVNIRNNAGTGCAIIGEGYPGQSVTAHCWHSVNGVSWAFLTDNSTGVTGWSEQQYIAPVPAKEC